MKSDKRCCEHKLKCGENEKKMKMRQKTVEKSHPPPTETESDCGWAGEKKKKKTITHFSRWHSTCLLVSMQTGAGTAMTKNWTDMLTC